MDRTCVPISEMSSLLSLKSSEKIIFRPIVVSLFYRMSFCQGYIYHQFHCTLHIISQVSLYVQVEAKNNQEKKKNKEKKLADLLVASSKSTDIMTSFSLVLIRIFSFSCSL
jgi:hypothetical protein